MSVPTSDSLPSPFTSPQAGNLRAPVEDRAVVSSPALFQARQLAQANSRLLNEATVVLAERPLNELRVWSRGACLAQAARWMQQNLGITPHLPEGLFYVTGHQPTLNHPGVWMKNVAVAHLARCSGTTGINLIVDNDLAGPSSIRVPGGDRVEPSFLQIPYDDASPAQPWEERTLQNNELFESFADRVAEALAPWNLVPGLLDCWPAALAARSRTSSTATLLTACRLADEKRWEIANLELPVSEMCRTEPFLAFALHLIQHHERFFAAYNSAVQWYRQIYHVRNHRHPVPDLEQVGNRFELPFWYWNPGDTDRQRVFAERTGTGITIFAGSTPLAKLPVTGSDLEELIKLQHRGRLRTRALTTTLFARLCLSDLFVHGIGGARYDEITTRLIEDFFGIPAPGFLTLTATVRLPLNPFDVSEKQLRDLRQRLRKLQFEGPREEQGVEVAQLRQQQAELIRQGVEQRQANYSRSERRALRGANRQRHLQLKRVQQTLGALAEKEIAQTELRIQEVEQQLRANAILKSREYPVCLFSQDYIEAVVSRLRNEVCTGRASLQDCPPTLSGLGSSPGQEKCSSL